MNRTYKEQGKKQYDNTNRGVFFTNEKRPDHPTDADFNGTINVEGKEYFLNIWEKQGNKGKFWSCSVKPKGQPNPNGASRQYTNQAPQGNGYNNYKQSGGGQGYQQNNREGNVPF